MDVIGLDMPVMDLLLRVSRLPEKNGGTKLLEYGMQGGGKVPTALAALGRLGASCGIVGTVGGDDFGRFCVEDLVRHRVDTTWLTVDSRGTTPFCVCLSESEGGGRQLLGYGGTCRRPQPEDVPEDYIASARYLHLTQMTPASVDAAKMAKKHGVAVSIDADSYQASLTENIGLLDILIASEATYNALFRNDRYEDNCRSLREKGPGTVIFTFGEKGCVGVWDGGFFQLPAYKVDAVDTTGAGDVFHGAYLFALVQGHKAPEAARFASAVSAIKCTRLGGRAGIPDLPTVEGFLRDGTIDYTDIDRRVKFYHGLSVRR